MHKKNPAAVALGRKGGQKKVPKGFARVSAEKRIAAIKRGHLQRWLNSPGKEKTFTIQLKITCTSTCASNVLAYGKPFLCDDGVGLVEGAEFEEALVHLVLANKLFRDLGPLKAEAHISLKRLPLTDQDGYGHSLTGYFDERRGEIRIGALTQVFDDENSTDETEPAKERLAQ